MLALGVEPKTSAATAATMIFFTSSSACVSFAVFGSLEYEYGAACFIFGLICTVIGQVFVAQMFKDRQSPTVFSIAIVILISSVCIGIETLLQGLADYRKGDLFKIDALCSVKE